MCIPPPGVKNYEPPEPGFTVDPTATSTPDEWFFFFNHLLNIQKKKNLFNHFWTFENKSKIIFSSDINKCTEIIFHPLITWIIFLYIKWSKTRERNILRCNCRTATLFTLTLDNEIIYLGKKVQTNHVNKTIVKVWWISLFDASRCCKRLLVPMIKRIVWTKAIVALWFFSVVNSGHLWLHYSNKVFDLSRVLTNLVVLIVYFFFFFFYLWTLHTLIQS
jgi:hypothetical protein